MKRLSLMMAIWLIPTAAMAQAYAADVDEEPGFVAPLSTIGSGDHPPSTTETSPANARSVRRAGKTVLLSNGDRPADAGGHAVTKMANAGS